MTPPDPINVYLSWAVYAVCGRLNDADAIMYVHGAAVRAVASRLRAQVPSRPLYRGVLLTAAEAAAGQLAAQAGVQSTSFTEDMDCARWFASTDALVAEDVVRTRPDAAGYLMESKSAPADVLFHHAWADVHGGPLPLIVAAAYAEAVGAIPETGAAQLQWNLRTQREVIVEAIRDPLPIRPVVLSAADSAALNRRFAPPPNVFQVAVAVAAER